MFLCNVSKSHAGGLQLKLLRNSHISKTDFYFLEQFADDVYLPTDEPHGTIEATVSRPKSKL